MLYRLEKLIGMSIAATDGTLGEIKDVYFDDRRWAVRYLVVETGDWLRGRKVLISPISVASIDWAGQSVRVRLTMQQVKGSPDIDTAMPVSRQHELNFLDYYGYPDYWTGTLLWGATPLPVPTHTVSSDAIVHPGQTPMDKHLRVNAGKQAALVKTNFDFSSHGSLLGLAEKCSGSGPGAGRNCSFILNRPELKKAAAFPARAGPMS